MPTRRRAGRTDSTPAKEGHVRWRASKLWMMALAVSLGSFAALGQSAGGASEVDAEAARRRLSELAERYAASQAATAPPSPPEVAAAREVAAEVKTPGRATVRAVGLASESARAEAGGHDAPGRSVDLEQRPLGPIGGGEGQETQGIGEPTGGWTLSTLAALGMVIGLIFAARWAYTKMGGKVVARSSPVVEVLSRTAVAPKSHVVLLRGGTRGLVVGDGGGSLNTLASLDDPEEVASVLQSVQSQQPTSVSQGFAQLMGRFGGEADGRGSVKELGGDASEIHVDRTRDALSGLSSRIRNLGGRGGTA